MAFCPKCGAQVDEGVAFCPACGIAMSSAPAVVTAAADDVSANKTMAIIGYIGILVIIPLITGGWKNSPFLKYHTNQSLILWIGAIAAYIVLGILARIPFLGWLFAILYSLVGLVSFILMIIGIVTANKGEEKPLPIIGTLITVLK
jgi:uncharacterized membrane protein